MNRNHDKEVDNPVELESQFILRMPPVSCRKLQKWTEVNCILLGTGESVT